MYSWKLCLIIRHYNTLHVAVLLSSVGVLQTQPVPANPSAFFLAAQGRSDGLDSFWGQQSRREIREQKQTELRKRRGDERTTMKEEERKLSGIKVTLCRTQSSPAKFRRKETRPPCNVCARQSGTVSIHCRTRICSHSEEIVFKKPDTRSKHLNLV